MKNKSEKLFFALLLALIIFLPFSSWLVSLTGLNWISLIRDLLLFGLVCILIFDNNIKDLNKSYVLLLALLFILFDLSSFFWREASVAQWLKGVRFTLGPILLFVAVYTAKIQPEKKNIIVRVISCVAVIVALFSVLELIGIKIPLASDLPGAAGSLAGQNSVSGNILLVRLQSILAGPNALGLYLLAVLALLIGKKGSLLSYLLISLLTCLLVLTFSRSAILSLIVLLIATTFYFLKSKIGVLKSVAILIVLLLTVSILSLKAYQDQKLQDFFTHGDSSTLRWQQYERIWNNRYQIGLFGEGEGTAGPASQYRLDNGPNHWTENVYLDIFEQLGLVGLIIYLSLIVALIINLNRKEGLWVRSAMLALISFSVAGIFINYYTGQAGIYLVWLYAAFAMKEKQMKNIGQNDLLKIS